MSKGGFRIISNKVEVVNETSAKLKRAEAEMAVDILNRAIMNAPKDTGALVRSGRVTSSHNGGSAVTFGDNSVRYAYKRHFENKKNPQTLRYLQKAGETVARGNIKKYLR